MQDEGVLEALLKDQTTGRNILWVTDAYADLGPEYAPDKEITSDLITGEHLGIIQTRALKNKDQQKDRTRKKAEVFTPFNVVKKMVDMLIEEMDEEDQHDFMELTMLEITCGEAPFLMTRYRMEDGTVVPIEERCGILDRKLQILNSRCEHLKSFFCLGDWLVNATRCMQSVYGYELLGDNLLIARINAYNTIQEYATFMLSICSTIMGDAFKQKRALIDTITWNLWQMDGLTEKTPKVGDIEPQECKIMDWLSDEPIPMFFKDLVQVP